MTEEEAIRVARTVAEQERWPWQEPVVVKREVILKYWLFGPSRILWHVMSNANCRGSNVNVRVEDATGQVVGKAYAAR